MVPSSLMETALSKVGLRKARYSCVLATVFASLVSAGQVPPAERHEQVLFEGQVQVPPGKQYNLSFATLSNFRNARIAGSVQAIGGAGNDIRVLVTKGQTVVYDSGKRRSIVISVDFSEPSQYTLIFSNSFSLVSPKAVTGRISLVHWGVDTEKNADDQRATIEHFNLATSTIQRLYLTLKADETVWGTRQLFGAPVIRLSGNRSINAVSNWTTNSIQVNRGLFDLTERAGERGTDVLAATLSHELSHIFYRHPGYGSGSGLKGLFDELRGVTALDRIQEVEADVLGIRVVCQSGFDPDGMLILMRVFSAMDQNASSFMRNHPSGIERLKYLQAEADKCRIVQARKNTTGTTNPRQAQTSPKDLGIVTEDTTATPRQALWTLAENPNSKWKFRVRDQFLFGERILPDERKALGDFDTVDVKRQGDRFVGTQRVRITFRIKDSSPEGYSSKKCQWDFPVELGSVTDERIEGKWESYPRDSKVNALTCVRSGDRFWESATWIRD